MVNLPLPNRMVIERKTFRNWSRHEKNDQHQPSRQCVAAKTSVTQEFLCAEGHCRNVEICFQAAFRCIMVYLTGHLDVYVHRLRGYSSGLSTDKVSLYILVFRNQIT